jgi:hypothetical protein
MNHSGITEFKLKSVVNFQKKFNSLKDESKNRTYFSPETELKHNKI